MKNKRGLIEKHGTPRFRRILTPIDATQVKSGDLKPVLEVAQRLDAEVTLLHCYEIPLSFHYAVGRSALMEVVLHRDLVRTHLLQLCAEVRKFFASCRSEFTVGSLPVEILSASQRLQSDVILVPLALDFGSYCWTTKEIMDELVRKADCPVVGFAFKVQKLRSRKFDQRLRVPPSVEINASNE